VTVELDKESKLFGKKIEVENTGKTQEKISMGITINFTDRTVQGTFGSISERLRSWLETNPQPLGVFDNPHNITNWDEAAIGFGMSNKNTWSDGLVDRITGDTRLYIGSSTTDVTFELKCKPAQKMF